MTVRLRFTMQEVKEVLTEKVTGKELARQKVQHVQRPWGRAVPGIPEGQCGWSKVNKGSLQKWERSVGPCLTHGEPRFCVGHDPIKNSGICVSSSSSVRPQMLECPHVLSVELFNHIVLSVTFFLSYLICLHVFISIFLHLTNILRVPLMCQALLRALNIKQK